MLYHDTHLPALDSSTDNSLELSSFKIDLLWIRKLGAETAILYCFLISLSNEKGLSFKKNQYFADRLRWSLTRISRVLKFLDDEGFISRVTIRNPDGPVRNISVKPKPKES